MFAQLRGEAGLVLHRGGGGAKAGWARAFLPAGGAFPVGGGMGDNSSLFAATRVTKGVGGPEGQGGGAAHAAVTEELCLTGAGAGASASLISPSPATEYSRMTG